jgi:hypothetical protein
MDRQSRRERGEGAESQALAGAAVRNLAPRWVGEARGDATTTRGRRRPGMTIKAAIQFLERIQKKHGEDVPVYFDCPTCGKSFTPTTVATVAMLSTAEPR